MRRIIIISTVVLVIALAGLLVYFFFFQGDGEGVGITEGIFSLPSLGDSQQNTGGNSQNLASAILEQQNSKVSRVGNEKVVGFSVTDSSVVVVGVSGRIREFDLLGNLQTDFENSLLRDVLYAKVSPEGDRVAILTSGTNKSGMWVLFDKNNEGLVTLPEETRDVSFSPGGDILRLNYTKDGSSIIVNSGGRDETIYETEIGDITAEWVDNNTVLLGTLPSGSAQGILYLLDKNSGRITRLTGSKFGLVGIVSPEKDWLLFSETNSNTGKNLQSKVLDISSGDGKTLTFRTLPERCAFSQDTRIVFCSTFRESMENAFMPDDYYKGSFKNFASDIVRVNLEQEVVETISPAMPADATRLEVTREEDALFFINKIDGNLYRLAL